PNIALLPYLTDFDVHYCGEKGGMEEKMLAAFPEVTFHALPCIKFRRSLSPKNLKVPFVLHKGIRQAKKLLDAFEPCAVFSKGGYAALPLCLAASKRRVPLVIHESDVSMGLSNRLVAKKAQKVCTFFPALAEKYPNGVSIGMPIRRELYNGHAQNIARTYSFPQNGKPNLLVFGGSQGALALNLTLEACLAEVCERFNVLHIAGKHTFTGGNACYRRAEFCNNMEDCYAWADYAVCRGGAGTLAEIVALRKPALVIPLPKSSTSRGDQQQNAAYYKKLGCIRVLAQEDLTPQSLCRAVADLLACRASLVAAMHNAPAPDGTRAIADVLRAYAKP
ncbi:MAG: UDP-N-acetylglucosamine--N-acetylmuramyl-(pentapeptide) pyrophosphoryl-undecaprenol N-acetylglucosamine transferase, partial [Clostridiales bacterium]|nr:UDP-N-acetylglucosamine--N-acetylmuramyl-(pentapeptide) pyrophosphoryl-undecaprenol N-acetylglucosamine transferase [Clostridiales bacterium]